MWTMDALEMPPRVFRTATRSLSTPTVCLRPASSEAWLTKVAGEKAVRLIREEADPTVQRIVEGWPRNFDPQRALGLGFKADRSFEEIIRIHIEDELQRTPQPRIAGA